jgi:predicted RNA-binding Zn-ribbon protein involved in translation (DUF1610 family)
MLGSRRLEHPFIIGDDETMTHFIIGDDETMSRVTYISEDEYLDYTENYTGYCTACQDFTRDSTEGDAEYYPCPDCGGNHVMGTENALISGLIEIA